jgi:drug/metabolite transporter (DMT)-like permease
VATAVVWAAIWAGAFVAMKLSLAYAPPVFVVAVRCLGAGVLLLLLTAGRRGGPPSAPQLRRLALLGLLNNAGYLGLMGLALPSISAGTAAILSASTPLLVVCASAARGEILTVSRAVGLVLGFGGIFVTSLSRLSGNDRLVGVLLGSAAVLALTAGTLLTPKLARGVDAAVATGWQALSGAVALSLPALWSLGAHPVHFTWELGCLLGFLALVASMLGMTLWLSLIQWAGPATASLAQFMPPLFGIALAHFVLGERTTRLEVIAALPVAAGVLLAVRKTKPRPSAAPSEERYLDSPGGRP